MLIFSLVPGLPVERAVCFAAISSLSIFNGIPQRPVISESIERIFAKFTGMADI